VAHGTIAREKHLQLLPPDQQFLGGLLRRPWGCEAVALVQHILKAAQFLQGLSF